MPQPSGGCDNRRCAGRARRASGSPSLAHRVPPSSRVRRQRARAVSAPRQARCASCVVHASVHLGCRRVRGTVAPTPPHQAPEREDLDRYLSDRAPPSPDREELGAHAAARYAASSVARGSPPGPVARAAPRPPPRGSAPHRQRADLGRAPPSQPLGSDRTTHAAPCAQSLPPRVRGQMRSDTTSRPPLPRSAPQPHAERGARCTVPDSAAAAADAGVDW